MLQGAGFTGAAAGVNLARDMEQGWLDRLLVSPAPRWVLLAGIVLSASARALIPATLVLGVALAAGRGWPGIDGLLVTYGMVVAMAAVAACWGTMLALRFKSQSAAPLMQVGTLAVILTTTAYAPLALLQGWLQEVARVNPVDPGGRRGPAGLRRRCQLGGHLARRARAAALLASSAHSPCARCAAPRREGRNAEIAERVLRQNWLEGERAGVPFAYTRPSPGRYPWQWFWDSCFAAIVWRRFDPARARAELESLLARAARGRLHRPHDLLGPPRLARPAPLLQRRLPALASDRDDPASDAGLGLADRRRRPGGGAADRGAGRLARSQPRPRRRRAALDRPAGRVGARRLAQVRPGLGPPGERADRLPLPGAPQPAARL